MQTALMNVRFEGHNGHDADVTRCLLMTQSGHERISNCPPLFNEAEAGWFDASWICFSIIFFEFAADPLGSSFPFFREGRGPL
jgi:hypothetical protein